VRWVKSLTVVCFLITLTGCSDFEKIQSEVISNNQRVDTALSNYKDAKKTGIKLEPVVLETLATKNTSLLDNESSLTSNQQLKENIKNGLNSVSESISTYVDRVNEDSKDTINPLEPINDIKVFTRQVTKVHYFLNDKTGVTEQMFLVQLPNGFVGGVSIYWVGGVTIDYKTFGLN
jgi:hypothetical protein